MGVERVRNSGNYGVLDWPTEHLGMTADTVAWLAGHTTEPEGSTYKELDGLKRLYIMHSGSWVLYSQGV